MKQFGKRAMLLGSGGKMFLDYYKNKRVFITGHTGFKGAWLTQILLNHGAKICGYSLKADELSLFNKLGLENQIEHHEGDVRDYKTLERVVNAFVPEFVFHLAAQPLVLESYKDPVYTYETNVMGTVNLLDIVRKSKSVISVINVTTDKVYRNNDASIAFKEDDQLSGFDPYSNSKSCSELVSESYINSFLSSKNIPLSTMRAGNVIGGGDYAENRIIPDCVRSSVKGESILIRNPKSVRPFQHVLEPLFAYLFVAYKQANDYSEASSYNIGPELSDCVETSVLVDYFCKYWDGATWHTQVQQNALHEAKFLMLDCTKIKRTFNWRPLLNVEDAVRLTVELSRALVNDHNYKQVLFKQIEDYAKTFEEEIAR